MGNPIKKNEIFNLFGQKVMEVNNYVNNINISNLASNVYMIHIHTNQGSVVKKLIKE